MTNDLEKQFFEAFGIEPKYESHSCDGWGRTVEVKYFTNKEEADKFGIVVSEPKYPQITDRILLELICIANNEDVYIELVGTDVETMKNNLLENFIHFKTIIPKHQVRTLFEER